MNPNNRNGSFRAAKQRNSAGPMKHKLTPRGGAKNDQPELLDAVKDDLYVDRDYESDSTRWYVFSGITGNAVMGPFSTREEANAKLSQSVNIC